MNTINRNLKQIPAIAEIKLKKIMSKVKQLELWLYGIGTVIIVKAVFGIGLPEGVLIALVGVGCLVAAYYISKHTRRF